MMATRRDGTAYCVPCDLPGAWLSEPGRIWFQPEPNRPPRWNEEVIRHHFVDKLLPSGTRFKARKLDLRNKVAAFQRGLDLKGRTS